MAWLTTVKCMRRLPSGDLWGVWQRKENEMFWGCQQSRELNLGSLEPDCLAPKPAGWLVPGSVVF